MSIEPMHLPATVAIGVSATLLMDLWNLFLKRVFSVASLNYCLLGRWVRHMPSGTFKHSSISATTPKPFECTVGWIAHYTIGIVFAIVFVALASSNFLVRPTLWPALVFGIATVVLPLFVMQPSLGFGVASSKARHPNAARLKSAMTHTVFGIGLYVSALLVSHLRLHM
jgi:hypothetical protein